MNRLSSHNEGLPSRQEIIENGDRALEILTDLHREVIKRRLTGAQYERANRPVSIQFIEAMEASSHDEREIA